MAKSTALDLSAIEKELNTDPKALGAFMKNPPTYLAGKGLKLTSAQKADVKSLVAEMKKGPKFAQGATAAKPRVSVTISISIRF
jgi:hypothetical protein